MDKKSFYRYVNAYNHYQNDIKTFDKFYEFPIQYNNYANYQKQKFLEEAEALCTLSNTAIKFYINKNVTNFVLNQYKFLFKWIQGKPIIFPHNPFCLQIEYDNTVAHLFFIEFDDKKFVTISYYRNNLTLFNSIKYEIHGKNFDLNNLYIGIDGINNNIKMYQDNYDLDRYNIWQCFMILYMTIYEKQIFYINNNKNKKEKKLYKNAKYNYADYSVIKIKDKIYKNFTENNKGRKQKSWHMVMSHLRLLPSGKTATVKSHTRGSKKIGIRLKDYEASKGKKIHESI